MLKSLTFKQYTTNELKPTGWLKNQLEIQAEGLSGNLDKIWPDIRDSAWIGGDCEGWERVPYWLDGFIPLAYLLEDDDLIARAKKYIDAIIDRQQDDGWIAPCSREKRNEYDMWAVFLICKVLVLYADCAKEEEKILPVIYKALKNLDRHIESNILFDWAAARWFECLVPLMWLYERKPEDWMLDLVQKLNVQGIDYEKLFADWRYAQRREEWSFLNHVVNIGMMIKSSALLSRFTGGDPNEFAKKSMEILLRDHGMACEHFSGDECLSGRSPIHGSECCSVTEAMYSYEWLTAITGDAYWADRLEKAAFNALPATISPDMWTHQYDQLSNQMQCVRFPDGKQPFDTNSEESHLFGLEPNYGCCTANFNQGWPKFAMSTFMKADDGIVVTAIAPSKLTDGNITAEIVTNYPFEDGYSVRIKAEKPCETALYLRIPEGAVNAKINSENAASGYNKILVMLENEVTVNVTFDFETKLCERDNDMYCVRRGNLTFSLPIGERWEKKEFVRDCVERKFPYCDYEIYPTTPWNYAFADDSFDISFGEVGKVPFSPEEAPLKIKAKFVPIEWNIIDGICSEVPSSRVPTGEVVELDMIPYGCTNLRMTEMPLVK
ncbi:MAG: glycoside hydrolase family 127 protein [Acutalibacteraceae bacterium]|nr:glycoside hydrolase family 127 protein [Acutalibacteraceae bacterium]